MASKTSAPTQPKGNSTPSISYSSKTRASDQVPEVKAKGQCSAGGLSKIDGRDPEVGTSSC